MSYEVTGALRSLREEGLVAFIRKATTYFLDLCRGAILLGSSHPRLASAEASVDYVYRVAGGLICPGQVRSEILALATLVRQKRPSIIVEIGTARGGTLFLWCANASPDATIISIDLPNGIHGGGYPYWKTKLYRKFAREQQQLHLWRANSHDPAVHAQLVALLAGRKLDFLFIDGDHSYAGVKTDFEKYIGLVHAGSGIVALHDVARHPPEVNCEVDRFWNELKERFAHREFIENVSQGWGGVGVLWV